MAIIPQPGYMVDPNNPNGVVKIGSTYNPASTAANPTADQMTLTYGGAPTANGLTLLQDTTGTQGTTLSPSQVITPSGASQAQVKASVAGTTASTSSVAGTNTVTAPAQSATQPYASVAGASVTPPVPGAADATPTLATGGTVADTLASLGPGATQYGTAKANPQSNSQLGAAYNSYFANTSGEAPNQSPTSDINATIASATNPDPEAQLFDAMGSMNPIISQLYTLAKNIMSPQNTTQTFTQEYQTLTAQAGIPGLQTQLMNIQNVMNGTEDDVRNEITAAGGFATESQVQGVVATRNKVLLKQASTLSNLLSTQQQYVQSIMQFSQADQSQVNTQVNEQTGLLETMATLQQSMNTNATSNYQKTLTSLGGDYGAFASTVPTSMKPYVEQLMGLAPGTLSDPQELQVLTNSSLKLMQLQIAAQRANVYAYNAGYPTSIPGAASSASVSPFASSNPVNQTKSQSEYTVQQGDGLRAIANKFGITSDAGIKAIATMNGIKDINQIQTGQQLQIPIPVKDNSTGLTGYIDPADYDPSKYTQLGGIPIAPQPSTMDKAYQSMLSQVQAAQATPVGGSPLNKGRLTRNANSALKNYIASPVYQAVSSGATYLARIQAAMKDPGSISDTSLADSIIKIETGGGQVTDSQISTYFAGQSFSDMFAVEGDKIVAKGGVLSPQQRSDLAELATGVFQNYQQQYENLYVQAMTNLQGQGIPLNYGGNLPDFLSLIATPTTQ